MIKPPIGLAWRKGFVRCTSDAFNKAYLIQQMKNSKNNIIPVVVLDIVTKRAKTYLINFEMTDFDLINDKVLQRRVEGIGTYMINKKNIQKSNKSAKEKIKLCQENERDNYGR
tara:strand:+ start:371 stop:709 length:339 start_codon:yes stop_codon:yes gene_type:complete